LLSSSGFSTSVGSFCSIGSLELSSSMNSYLDELVPSLMGKMFSKNIASLDFIIVPTCMSGTPDFTIKNL